MMVACWRGIIVLTGGFLLHLTLGSGFTAGNMSPYITSYFHAFGSNPDVTSRDAVWVFTMVKFGQGLLMSVGGILDSKIGPRITAYIGGMIASIGVAVTYFTIETSLTVIVLTYGLMFGIGISIAYVPPMAAAMKWFPEHKGLVNGIIVGGFGLGAFIFTQVQTFYLNPNNSPVDSNGYFTDYDVLNRVPRVFLLLAALYSTLQLVGCSVLTHPKRIEKVTEANGTATDAELSIDARDNLAFSETSLDKEESPSDAVLNGTTTEVTPPPPSVKKNYTPKEMLKCRQFYILWLTFCLNHQIVIYITSMYKAYGQTFIKDDKFLAIVGAISAIFNSFGRMLWGWIMDKTNYKICMLVLTAGVAVFTATLSLAPYGGKAMFAIWIWAIFLFFSGSFSLLPTCTTNTFGIKHAGINYGIMFTNTLISSPLAAILTQHLSSSLGWHGIFGMLAAFSFLSFITTIFFKELQPKESISEAEPKESTEVNSN